MGKYARARRERDNRLVDSAASIVEDLTRQLMVDCVSVALHSEFGFGKERIKRALRATSQVWADYGKRMFRTRKIRQEHGEDLDSDYQLARDQMDRMLQMIFTDEFSNFEERYGGLIKD